MTAVVDAHLHVWDLARSEYAWLTQDLGPLHATFTPEQAHAELEAAGIASAVLVQAEDSERDTELMLEAARRHPWVAGVVGWVQLDDPAVAERQLDRRQDDPRFRGVRHLVHDDPRDDFLLLPPVRRSLGLLAELGIPFDVPDAWPRHLAATADLAAALGDLRIVVDHLGKPPYGGPDWKRWRDTLRKVAAHPNTTAKVSGLQVPGRPLAVSEVRPAWEVALELFGPKRLMWGSDWPLTVLVGGYAHVWDVMSSLVAELSPDEQALLLSGTATSVYHLS
ncbi:MAG: amidohydrolase family protein [Actinomycetota bacterium]